MKRLLLTKHLQDVSETFRETCSNASIDLIAQSFISFQPVVSEPLPDFDVVFFGSKRAVDFFLEQFPMPPGKQIACIGQTTANHLINLGFAVGFSGEEAGNATEVALKLKDWLGERSLLVARSEQSQRSIPKVIPSSQLEERVVYQTILKPMQLAVQPEMIAFTSPSNVAGFLRENQITANQTLIAWGTTTRAFLEDQGHTVHHTLRTASEEELAQLLNSFS